ncbi:MULTISPECIES: HpcH/HpaI aldolase family protein [Variovorax]|uniref:HpcH/HpaI aldolase family protein n=1 Tax=Variovorax TaxID=34072 RepID=UPI0028606D1D|nr:aldolase/citrate lyase family protein [Variovorax sp. 3319]MDR6890741.1 2-keto-3-deoxy-L-rhamnonate aldolase RhmA [Variovorax sp. 3319]
MHSSTALSFRELLRAGDRPLFGTFIKTPAPQPIEIIGALGFDFVIIDAEHGPFDRGHTDIALLAAKAAGVAPVVRVANAQPEAMLAALDDGAAGVMVPHVKSAALAREVVASCRYHERRGFSNGCRAGAYGAIAQWPHIDASDAAVTVIAMIEDPEAVEDIDRIVQTEGLDAIFIGRADLSVALGDRSVDGARVRTATARILAAARREHMPAMLLAAHEMEAKELLASGVHAFVIASDQGFLRQAAGASLSRFREAMAPPDTGPTS